ncbi:S-adenosyl-L-methionine-dependent methyltransferase [Violaceomyces palustris]|uniref:S-adenosyl-L-methionine-dependent methyltransferase n=1 Tax=Violaceomyces palustris TaxID=1673888 RepID=A0ACD0NTE7_9BASI|nr:S-adenosyl-L-methionine-dependent methyltransferase [Violaceomyces palustris]
MSTQPEHPAINPAPDSDLAKVRSLLASSEKVNDGDAWDKAWLSNLTPWDAKAPQPALLELLDGKHDDQLKVTGAGISSILPTQGIALVPGCGRGYDATLFAQRLGLQSWGVDISPTAVDQANQWLADQQLAEDVKSKINFAKADFFKLGTSETSVPELGASSVDLAYDYTFLCALPPSLRKDWSETYTRLLKPGGHLICLVYPIQGDRPGGPPFSISPQLVRSLLTGGENQGKWSELCDVEPKNSKGNRIGIERVMVWRRL